MKKNHIAKAMTVAAIFVAVNHVQALDLKDCPAPVVTTVNDNLGNGETVTSIKSVTEGDWTYFEVNTNQEGYMTVDPDGTLESIDLGTEIDDVPAAAKTAIQKLPGELKDVYMELNNNGDAEYTVRNRVQGAPVDTKITADGSVVK